MPHISFVKAADQGYAQSEDILGVMYREGKGVQQSFTLAAKWWRRAADQGSARAQCGIGKIYEFGHGVR